MAGVAVILGLEANATGAGRRYQERLPPAAAAAAAQQEEQERQRPLHF